MSIFPQPAFRPKLAPKGSELRAIIWFVALVGGGIAWPAAGVAFAADSPTSLWLSADARIVPAGPTYSHPILTLGTRFTETEDLLLSTYLHEQMHWYLSLLGGPDHDPVEPVFDELVRRYPQAPEPLTSRVRAEAGRAGC